MRRNSHSPARRNQAQLELRERNLRLEVAAAGLRAALLEYRASMLGLYLAADPELRKLLTEIFQEDTGEPLIEESPSDQAIGEILAKFSQEYRQWLQPLSKSKSRHRRAQREKAKRHQEISDFLHYWATKKQTRKLRKKFRSIKNLSKILDSGFAIT